MKFVPEIIYICLVAVYSLIVTRYIPKKYYSFSNILIAAGAIAYGIAVGLSNKQLGFDVAAMKQSLIVGVAVVIPVMIAILVIASHSQLQAHFSNTPAKQYNLRTFCYELLFRVPFGTALSEEVIFRSVLLAILVSNHNTITAIAISSILFGLWHVFPTLHTIKSHDPLIEVIDDTRRRSLVALGTTVCATALAGTIFAILTTATGSFVAAWLLHSTINGFAILGGYLVVWRQHRTANNSSR